MAVEEFASIVPRTLYHILTVPDAAISFKWIVQLPRLPKPYEGNGISEGSASNTSGSNSILGRISNTISVVSNTIKSAVETIDDTIGPTPLMMRAETVSFSPEQLTSSTIQTQARLRSFPSSISVQSVNITFFEDYNYTALTYLNRWQKCIVNDNSVFRAPNGDDGYAKEMKLHLFDTAGLKKGVVTFIGCYPERIGEFTFGSESGIIKTSCDFNVQRIRWEPSALNWGSTLASAKSGIQNILSKKLF